MTVIEFLIFNFHIKNRCLFLVKVTVKSRVVQVTGKRGKLVRSFRHARVDISMPKKNLVVVEKWFGTNKENAVVRTICSHINNMIKGVTKVRAYQ
jgi:large subunit ribosomal protein L9e